MVQAVVFDVGETLVDESRIWSDWADWLGIPRLTFMATLGAVLERGGDHRDVFRLFRPELDVAAEMARRAAAGRNDNIGPEDLYPDAVAALRSLRGAGFRLGIAGNQPARAEAALRALEFPVELLATSAGWGVSKPDPRFFTLVAEALGLPPEAIAYVGDRIDNDVEPAAAAGMRAIWVRRGPWAWIQAGRDEPASAAASIDSLAELIDVLEPDRRPLSVAEPDSVSRRRSR